MLLVMPILGLSTIPDVHPADPLDLRVLIVEGRSVHLVWRAVQGAFGYTVFRGAPARSAPLPRTAHPIYALEFCDYLGGAGSASYQVIAHLTDQRVVRSRVLRVTLAAADSGNATHSKSRGCGSDSPLTPP